MQSIKGPIGGAADPSFGGEPVSVTIVASRPWPTRRFPVPAGGDVAAAVAAANKAGGGVIVLAPGLFEMGNLSLQLGDNVQLVGAPTTGPQSVLHWSKPTHEALISNMIPAAKMRVPAVINHLTCDDGTAWAYNNATQQLLEGKHSSSLRCLTATLPPVDGAPLTLQQCATPPSPEQQWVVNGTIRLAAQPNFGGSPGICR